MARLEAKEIRDIIDKAAKKMGITVEEYLRLAIKQKDAELSKKKPYNGVEPECEIGIH